MFIKQKSINECVAEYERIGRGVEGRECARAMGYTGVAYKICMGDGCASGGGVRVRCKSSFLYNMAQFCS